MTVLDHTKGYDLYFDGRHAEAEAIFRNAVQANSDDPNAHNGLGLALAAQGMFDKAIKQYRKAATLWQKAGSTDRKVALINWGDALRLKKLYGQAAEKYREFIAVDPDYPNAYNLLGLVLAAQELFEEAIGQYGKADALWQKAGSSDRKFALTNWSDALLLKKLYGQTAEKCREAIALDPDYPNAYNLLGLALAAQELFEEAIAQYSKADTLWQKAGSTDRKFALCNWGRVLGGQERFEDAVAKYALAIKVAPEDASAFFNYGNGLAACGKYRDAIAQFDKVALLDREDPYPCHNKAHFLFTLGRYEEGWKEWRIARSRYESVLSAGLCSGEHSEIAVNFADALREVFSEFAEAERYYQKVLDRRGDDASGWTGLGILYQQWVNSGDGLPEIQARLSYTKRRAGELLRSQLGSEGQFQTFMSLADLYIETHDLTQARESLALAASMCNGSSLKHAEVTVRTGLVCFQAEEYAEAVKNFRQALLVKAGDLTLRCYLGEALLRSKQFESALEEFSRVLKSAPGHIDGRLGAAQVCIELADDGDLDQYKLAEQHLTTALDHGRNRQSGSKRLRSREIANIYYLRGYVRVKRYESDAAWAQSGTLIRALFDFRQCKRADPNHTKATAAIEKITKRLGTRAHGSLVDWFGPLFVFSASAVVFVFAQLDFFFRGTTIHTWFRLPAASSITSPTLYTAITFGSLLFMIAGLYLPKVLKLKVAGIELEKASVNQVSAPSTLDISRSRSGSP